MSWLRDFIRPKIRAFTRRNNVPENLWHKCQECDHLIYHRELIDNLCVCQKCNAHMFWDPQERLAHLFGGSGQYQLLPSPKAKPDPLMFKDLKKYSDRLKEARKMSPWNDSVGVAFGKVAHFPVVCAVFHFSFIGGSMGIEAGESIVTAAKEAIARDAALVIIPASGGARMQEGMLSLIQMPRTVLAVSMVKEKRLPVFILLTHPTTGGVAASFASLGDIILAEPKAIVGFTGPRVLKETLRQSLPPGFQTSEFQKDHGFIDCIVDRKTFPEILGTLLKVFMPSPSVESLESNF